jgi:hypothetical protein
MTYRFIHEGIDRSRLLGVVSATLPAIPGVSGVSVQSNMLIEEVQDLLEVYLS